MIFLKEIIKAYYDLDIDEISSYSVHLGYNEVYKIKTTSKEFYALKVHLDKFVNANQIEEQAMLKRHLKLFDIPAVPYIATIEFKHSIEVKGQLITLEPWVEGIKVEMDDFIMIKALQEMMANMHQICSNDGVVQIYSGTRWRIFGENKTNSLYDYDEIDLKFKALIAEIPEIGPGYSQTIEALKQLWSDLPEGVVHGDLSLDNCSFDSSGQVVALYDFNLMGIDKFVSEMAQSTILNVFFNRRVPVSYERGLIEIAKLIDAYEAIRPLDEVETNALPLIFRLSFVAHFGFKLPKELILDILKGAYDGVALI